MFYSRGRIIAHRDTETGSELEFENNREAFKMGVPEEYLGLFKNFVPGKSVILSTEESDIFNIIGAGGNAIETTQADSHSEKGKINSSKGVISKEKNIVDEGSRPGGGIPQMAKNKQTKAFIYKPSVAITLDTSYTISELSYSTYADLYTVVTSCMPLIETRGTDYLFTLGIADETRKIDLRVFLSKLEELEKFCNPNVKIDFSLDFRKKENFYKIFRPGDILHIRNVKLGQGGNMALIHKSCTITKLANAIDINNQVELPTEPANLKAGRQIAYFSYFYCNFCAARPPGRTRCGKDKYISELEKNSYANVTGKVLFMECGHMTSVCITDFTCNTAFPSTARGTFPLNMLLYVNIFGKYNEMLRDVKIGDVCRFENIRIRDQTGYISSHMSESKSGLIAIVSDQAELDTLREREILYYRNNPTVGGGDDSTGKDPQKKAGKGYSARHQNYNADIKVRDDSEMAKLISAEIRKDFCAHSANAEYEVVFSAIRSIMKTGVYLIKCSVQNYTLRNSKYGPYLLLTLRDTHDTLRVMARQKIAKLLLNSRLLTMNLEFMCMMVLCMDLGKAKNYLVNMFFDDDGLIDISGKKRISLH
ncbi:hypothetical protein PAEPH01_0411 [Pancytospora epiphaga]|nr:hypothetical protein PAEPH01_0411 [Pancytospora epiphaga]